mmetsp:Transcript_23397/g.32709  ORF Transcript_23397/g.32709 Transcript_23397/m.32709 type:complete len:173 (+) Transcript_23397:160-678(+)|eukprot:CAMPEP_0185251126 /NCGR_PEP_ID=MMETSP1359-20130426/512_1 /TAXON_ID=552665 /ORGANISM="Bigelowiella longifila, Strain CCMP242" /LENGTH=172 /DNA_ID=CAMNT_0027832877 /DNA_START=118 /DNA_END=636 /DNA_ORIENTATION=-
MASKPKASGAGVYNKRISGSGQGAVITRSNGETVKQATDEEAHLRANELMESLNNSNKRLTLEEFVKKHKDTMDDINIADNEESRMQYRKQLDAERRKRMKQIKKRKKEEEKARKSKKKKKKEKKKKKKKEKKKKKKKEKDSADDDDSDSDSEDSDDAPQRKKQRKEEQKKS